MSSLTRSKRVKNRKAKRRGEIIDKGNDRDTDVVNELNNDELDITYPDVNAK